MYDVYIFVSDSNEVKENIFQLLKKRVNSKDKEIYFIYAKNKSHIDVLQKSVTDKAAYSTFQLRPILTGALDDEVIETTQIIKTYLRKNFPHVPVWCEATKFIKVDENELKPIDGTDFCWYISPSNGNIRLSKTSLYRMVCEFYYVELMTGKTISHMASKANHRKGTYGLVRLEYPVIHIVQREAMESAKMILRNVVNAKIESLEREAKEFCDTEIKYDDIKNRLVKVYHDVRDEECRRLKRGLRNAVEYINILSNLYDFLIIRISKLYKDKIKEKYHELLNEKVRKLNDIVDNLMHKVVNPRALLGFLRAIYECAHRNIERYSVEFKEIVDKTKDDIEALRVRYAKLPSIYSALLRIGVFTFGCSYLTVAVWKLLTTTGVGFWSHVCFGIFYLIVFSVIFMVPVFSQRRKLWEEIFRVERNIWGQFDDILERKAIECTLNVFECIKTKTDKEKIVDEHGIPNECGHVYSYIDMINRASKIQLQYPKAAPPVLDLTEYIDKIHVIRNFDVREDLRSIVDGINLHKGWRDTTPEKILQRVVDFLMPKITVEPATIVEGLKLLTEDAMNRLKNAIMTMSAPFYVLDDKVVTMYVYGRENDIVKNMFTIINYEVIDVADAFVFLRLKYVEA